MSNQIAVDFIKQHEGCRLEAYLDGGGVPTIGYGHTGPDVHLGLTWTQDQADAALLSAVAAVENNVRKAIDVALGPQAFAALDSFTFNLGWGAFVSSTLHSLINAADYIGAAKEFVRWDHDNGKEVKGLLIRRLEEAALFLKGVT